MPIQNKLRVALDTNVLVSAALFNGIMPIKALEKASQQYILISSYTSFDELQRVLPRSKFDPYASLERRSAFIHTYGDLVEFVFTKPQFTLCRDPKDNHWLDLAVQGKLDILVTGDADLLTLHPFQNTQILTPQQFLDL